MARLDHIRQRLEKWARWRARREAMGIGYPRQAAFLRVQVDGGRGRADTSSSEADAQEVDLAVDAMKLDPAKSRLAKALELVYLGPHGGGVEQAARAMGKAVSTVHDYLAQADHAIGRWLQDRAEARKRKRVVV